MISLKQLRTISHCNSKTKTTHPSLKFSSMNFFDHISIEFFLEEEEEGKSNKKRAKEAMDRTRAKAKEFGRNLFMRGRGGSEHSDQDSGSSNPSSPRLSWSQVVAMAAESTFQRGKGENMAGKPVASAGEADLHKGEKVPRAGMPGLAAREAVKGTQGGGSGKLSSLQRLFSADDVAKLVELARKQLRKQMATSSGWQEVETNETRRKEKTYAREVVDDFRRSPETELKYWQCNQPGHISSACPRGERCFKCNSTTHKRADCPTKYRATRAEKGKAKVEYGYERKTSRREGVGPLWIGEQPTSERRPEVHRVEVPKAANIEKQRNERHWRPGRQRNGDRGHRH